MTRVRIWRLWTSTAPRSVIEPVRIGPEGLPELTLGWSILAWCSRWLLQPDGPDAGEAWKFTPEQARFVLWWYAVDPRGRFVYRSGVLRRSKGWGKDPVGAALCAVEFCGPARVARLDADAPGGVVGKQHPAPWVQTAAVSKDQTRNTMTLFPGMFSKDAITEFGVDLGKEIIHRKGGGRIEAVTSSPRALEGGRSTFVLRNETHHWLKNNDGHAMADVIARNLAKSRDGSARALAITNAHNPGEDSSAEHDWDAWQKIAEGKSKATGFLYDSLEAPAGTKLGDPESLRAGLVAARGDSTWLDVDRLVEEIMDPRTPPSMARRFYLNQVVAAEDAWMRPSWWQSATSELVLEPGDAVALGFDGSKSDDATALVACRLSDGLLHPLKVWEQPDGEAGKSWTVPTAEVDDLVGWAFKQYRVAAFFADVAGWESYIDKWNGEYGAGLTLKASPKSPVGFDMRGRLADFTSAAESFLSSTIDGLLVHTGDGTLTRHVLNARRRPNRFGLGIGKEHRESARKVDAAVSAVLAWQARNQAQLRGAKARTGRVV